MKFVHTADTHLGFEITKAPQGHPEGRRRRAASIFRHFQSVADHALEIEADLFIHSGDLFNKFYIPRRQLDELVSPMVALSRSGIPVLVIPGNHERSAFPFDLFHGSKNVFVFDRPKSICLNLDGYSVGIAGFPFLRDDSRRTFGAALEQTEYAGLASDLNILVTHQAFDQATVGPGNFVFGANRRDTVSRHTVPTHFEYIAAGHIHRYQILDHPFKPGLKFVYPGSVQRVSFAEKDEEKGFVVGELVGERIMTRFVPLAAHAMEMVRIEAAGMSSSQCMEAIRGQYWRFSEDMVIRFQLVGGSRASDYPRLDFDRLRAEMPPVMECQFAVQLGGRWKPC